MKRLVSFLSLFTSFGTLICCAIPSLLVLLGAGAAVAGFVSAFPQLIWLSKHKLWIFGIGGILLLFGFLSRQYSKTQVCPPDQKDHCEKSKQTSDWLWWFSVGFYAIGFTVTFVLPKIVK